MPETFIDECIQCGHRYDRDEHDSCPSCSHDSLNDYPGTREEADS